MIDSINQSIAFPQTHFQEKQSPIISYYQHFLGEGTTPQQAQQFLQGLEQWMNHVFASFASGMEKANEALKESAKS